MCNKLKTPKMNIEIKQPAVILVEGENDKRFIEEYAKFLNIKEIQSINVGSKDNFSNGLKAILPNIDRIKCLGIMKDAEEDPDRSFRSIYTLLKNNNLPLPSNPLDIAGDNPAVIVLIIPHDRPGSLETLCLDAISNDINMQCVSEYMECLSRQGFDINKLTTAKRDKVRLQVFLASKRPELRLGEAAQAGLFPFDSQEFERIKIFLDKISKSIDG
ncbi:MAG: hypothetical protein N3A00_03030 [Thermodesulfovibrio sp.]|nr:hypothetical protein [Thermodesulfovibrio sp.]